jgi:hypothetical protein
MGDREANAASREYADGQCSNIWPQNSRKFILFYVEVSKFDQNRWQTKNLMGLKK